MIQDIGAHRFHNEFKVCEIEDQDYVLAFEGNDAWVLKGSDDRIDLLTFEMIKDDAVKEDFHYAFCIDEKRYFLDLRFGIERNWQAGEKVSIRTVRKNSTDQEKENCFAVQSGWHLYVWYRDNQYCGRCGAKAEYGTKERNMICPKCKNMIFPRINPACIIGVWNKDRLLMSQYAGNGFKHFALLAGFMEFGETGEEAVEREVFEEVGVKVKNIRYYKTQPWGLASDILIGYYCELDGSEEITLDQNELKLAGWFERDEIPENDGISLTYEMMGLFKHHPELFPYD